MRFSHTFRVADSDIDDLGHVNNVAYLRWVQDVAISHWLEAASEECVEKYNWVVVRHEIDYKKPAFAGDEVTAMTWVGKWTAATCERFTEIRRNNEILAAGRTVWCMVDRETGRPVRILSGLTGRFA